MLDHRILDKYVRFHLKLRDRIIPSISPDEYIIAISLGGHNGSITVAKGNEVLEVLELERFINLKNAGFSPKPWKDVSLNKHSLWSYETVKLQLIEVRKYLSRKYTDEFGLGIFVDFLRLPELNNDIDKFFKVKNNNWVRESHHLSHGAGAFYQSDFKKSLVFTIDGGSIDGVVTAGLFERGQVPEYFDIPVNSLGRSYYKFARLLGDIKFIEHGQSGTYPGKLMGLAGYGTPDAELTKLLKTFYLKNPFYPKLDPKSYRDIYKRINKKYADLIPNFTKEFDNPFCEIRIKGEEAYTLAASAQLAFEEVAIEFMLPYIKQYPDLPICISGGCALNIPLNTRLVKELGRTVFVPPDPTDCGLSLGAMLNYLKPEKAIDNPYLGPELLDKDMMGTYLYEEFGLDNPDYKIIANASPSLVASRIINNRIIGICQGRSERGPRALGNRSIICSVLKKDMKDIINAKVKHREWYRPFSPIVRLEDVSKYFEWEGESRFMTFSPLVKEEYREIIKPVVHADNTARVQTITREQNEFIYDLLTVLDRKTGVGMILNTSFNVDSRPIVSSIKDAIKVLKTTELDGIYIEGTLILKNS